MYRTILTFCMLLWVSMNFAPLLAQVQQKPGTPSQPSAAIPTHDAKPADVASPDAILAATYDVISGPAGQERDWDRFRSLFYPGARLIRTEAKKEGGLHAAVLIPEDFVERAGNYFKKNGFYEREIARRAERWGSLTQAFSTYESRHDPKDPAPFARGINSFQLFFDGTRWWVMTIYWADESSQTPLPPEFLPSSH
ncbi:MAG TPA: hypothetical protein VH140_15070 [Candidatus Acidoferrum sp.]|nr:hypothetical protein [Candidatus Acidoferrum sp.]